MTMDESEKQRLFILIGVKIRKARRKLSQESLARKVKLSRTSITNIEAGRQHLTIDTLWHIATQLEVSPLNLLPSPDELNSPDEISSKVDSDELRKWLETVMIKVKNDEKDK